MSKKYFIRRGEFGNVYNLAHADAGSPDAAALMAAGFERITRQEAINKCREERSARRSNPNFAYFADAHIYPAAAVLSDMVNRAGCACYDLRTRAGVGPDNGPYILN